MDERQYIQEDEITLKELILKIQEYYREVLRNWKWVVLITIPFVAYFLYKAMTTPPTYTATLTYMVNEDEGGGLGGVNSILSQFGLGGGGNSEFNLDKIVQLSKSRRIINSVLMEKVEIEGKNDYLANHIIRIYDMHERWAKGKGTLKGFLFVRDSIPQFNRLENAALKSVYGKVIGNAKQKVEGLLQSGYTEESGILNLAIKSEEEELSLQLVDRIYNQLSHFYIDKTIEKQQHTYDIVKAKKDSLEEALNRTQYQYLKFDDTNRGIQLNQYQAKKLRLQRDLQVLATAYGEVVKNLEIADFSLKTSTPFFQEVDVPVEPIRGDKKSKLKALVVGGLLGAFFGTLYIIGRKFLIETMV